jgi:hypothetical protein
MKTYKYKGVKIIEDETDFVIKTNGNTIQHFQTEEQAEDYVDLFSDNKRDLDNLLFFSNQLS